MLHIKLIVFYCRDPKRHQKQLLSVAKIHTDVKNNGALHEAQHDIQRCLSPNPKVPYEVILFVWAKTQIEIASKCCLKLRPNMCLK